MVKMEEKISALQSHPKKVSPNRSPTEKNVSSNKDVAAIIVTAPRNREHNDSPPDKKALSKQSKLIGNNNVVGNSPKNSNL